MLLTTHYPPSPAREPPVATMRKPVLLVSLVASGGTPRQTQNCCIR